MITVQFLSILTLRFLPDLHFHRHSLKIYMTSHHLTKTHQHFPKISTILRCLAHHLPKVSSHGPVFNTMTNHRARHSPADTTQSHSEQPASLQAPSLELVQSKKSETRSRLLVRQPRSPTLGHKINLNTVQAKVHHCSYII